MKDIYTPAEAAADILQERKQDKALQERVSEYLGGILPEDFPTYFKAPAILARYVPRATGEDRMYAELADQAGFAPFWASYLADRFTTRNPEKVETVRPPIQWQKGQKTRSWVVEPEKRSGGVGQLETTFGYSSADYQKGIRDLVFAQDGIPEEASYSFDMAEWYKLQAPRFGYIEGNLAPYYYPAMMGLVSMFGVLFEDFDGGPNANNGDLAKFREAVVYPAIEKVEQELGLKPLIVRLPFQEGMNETDLTFLDKDEAEQFKRYGSLAVEPVILDTICSH